MKLILRFLAPLLAVLFIAILGLTPIVEALVTRWFRDDIQMRARLVFLSIERTVDDLTASKSNGQIVQLFDTVSRDERVLALGLCNEKRVLVVRSKSWPVNYSCPVPPGVKEANEIVKLNGRGTLISSFQLGAEGKSKYYIVIMHDMSFALNRSVWAWRYMMATVILLGAAIGIVAFLVAQRTMRNWVDLLRLSLDRTVKGVASPGEDPALAPVLAEIRLLLRDLDISRSTTAKIRIDWSPESLRNVVRSEIPDAEVVVLSNREPYIHNRTAKGKIEVQHPASGLVTALEPIVKACGGVWIAHGSGSADRETVDARDRVQAPPDNPTYTLRRLWLTEAEEAGYYYGLSNEGLWPLCHISYVRPVFREEDWEYYQAVNERFAAAVVAEAETDHPIVLVQDYHLALAPRMIRNKLPKATIISFWHIPWPNAEVFGIFPWRAKLLDGLLGADIVGFHTQLHCNNFIDSADRFLECRIDREQSSVSTGGEAVLVRPYPISIQWPPEAMKKQAPVPECHEAVFKRFGLRENALLAVGVERFDFTKGIPDRIKAVDILLERFPEWRGRFVLLQVAAPTRSKLPAYQALISEANAIADEVNEKYGRDGYKPVLLKVEHFEPDDIFELFRAANICIVSSLHDGMNLVAKEFVASRDDEQGVLILSHFAGASRELMEGLIVNPYDARATAEAIDRALRMSPQEQRDRMRFMRTTVAENNIYYWAGRMLLDAARLRKRERIAASIKAIGGLG